MALVSLAKSTLGGGTMELCANADSFHSLLCLEGEGEIVYDGKCYAIVKGDRYFIPAGLGKYEIKGNLTAIVSRV